MKKSLLALAVLAASGVAMAQSSVTLYGVVDTGVTYLNGKENRTGLTHVGGNVNSRIGFRGVEDLGGGVKATFNLESGLSADDGKNYMNETGLAFNRTSTVGLAGGFGELRLGRMLTSSYLAVSRYDAFGDTGTGGTRAWAKGYSARATNAVSYTSANYGGFVVGAEYGFGEQVDARDSRYVGVGAKYDNGPLSFAAGYDRANANKAAAGANDLTTWQLGGAYNLGVAKLMGFYKDSKTKPSAGGSTNGKFKTAGLGLVAPVGSGEVKVSYNNYRLGNVAGKTPKANQLSLGYVQNLSKRTAVYGTYSYLKDKDGVGVTLNNDFAAGNLKDNGTQHGVQVGIRHAF